MALIPAEYDDIAEKIYATYEERENGPRGIREHLGASEIGQNCARRIWYGFRWFAWPSHKGQLLRLFKRGHNEEANFTDDLRDIGVELYDLDPRTGKQIQVRAWYGHFGGSLDGVGRNIPHRGPGWHLLEYKTHNAKSFNKLRKEGVQKSKPKHFAQMQIYMGFERLERALYCAVLKDTDSLHFEVVAFNEATFKALCDKAEMIVFAKMPPGRISDSPEHNDCKWCPYAGICHNGVGPARNCRTCKHSEPMVDGFWHCNFDFLPAYHTERGKNAIEREEQIAGCEEYELLPTGGTEHG